MLAKEKIKEAFSKAAATYGEASDFQKEAGYRLIGMALSETGRVEKILDIGIGTGGITQELHAKLGSEVYGCDMAWGMISVSRINTKGVFIIQADAEDLPYKENSFDLAFSNITYQWMGDLKGAFLEVRRVLKRGARFYFSILAKNSLQELHKTIDMVLGREKNGHLLRSAEEIKAEFTESDFKIIRWEQGRLKRYYKNSFELVKVLKRVGAGRVSETNLFGFGQRKVFFDMLQKYDEAFSEGARVFATYEVIFGCVEKR